jgi:hypothetical protein
MEATAETLLREEVLHTAGATEEDALAWRCGAPFVVTPYYRGRHIFITAGQKDTCPCTGNSGGMAGNSHRPGGNALAKL